MKYRNIETAESDAESNISVSGFLYMPAVK